MIRGYFKSFLKEIIHNQYLFTSSVIPDSPQQMETREQSQSPIKEVESVSQSHVSAQYCYVDVIILHVVNVFHTDLM